MSQYYKPSRTYNLYNPQDPKPFKLSRSKIDLFIKCPRCFYLDRRLGVGQPPGYPFTLNAAVDFLLKKEFDIHRAKGVAHPLMEEYKIKAVPIAHEKIEEWRDYRRGIQYFHEPTNLLIFGAIDDIWLNEKGEFMIVDYKATSKDEEVSLDADWQEGYKKQVEIYQWLFRKNGFKVSNIAYFVYCNGIRDAKAFDGKLEFNISIIPYKGSDKWVEKTIKNIHKCLKSDKIPESNPDCDYCNYFLGRKKTETS